ncbi:MAG: tRNA 4-thiouridine(8) synthase ThiI [Thaumarchaeota archaeon]|mgnify:FL=1|nr:MAG: tRNA 4-thiouridine(8) synthase ThiI [Nitrososphaerota archaeon]
MSVKPRYDAVVIHYGEVTLKRGKRGYFERTLLRNLKRMTGADVKRLQGRFVIKLKEDTDLNQLLKRIGKVFGVVWYAPAIKAKDLNEFEEKIVNMLELVNPKSFKLDTRRSDKSFPMTSMEFSKMFGEKISSRLGLKVDLKNPEKTIIVEITENGIYASHEKISGPGGLPIGVSGKVLALISGGIDSPVAAWFMMRRGCIVDSLHIYNLPSIDEVMNSKIPKIIKKLVEYCFRMKLYLLPFKIFWEKCQEIPEKFRLIAYRAYMFKLADIIAERYRYLGIVSGDNLGQVASQTLQNMFAISAFAKSPIYRPLIGFDKQETTELAKKIGTYDLSVIDYPEPCMILGKYHPKTDVKVEEVQRIWMDYDLEGVVKETLKELEIYEFKAEAEKPIKL